MNAAFDQLERRLSQLDQLIAEYENMAAEAKFKFDYVETCREKVITEKQELEKALSSIKNTLSSSES